MQDAAPPNSLACPKCGGTMRIQRHPENDAYRCEGCHGLWLPLMAHEQLEERADRIPTDDAYWLCAPAPQWKSAKVKALVDQLLA